MVNGVTSKNSALLVIDVINSCCHPKCEIKKWNISFNKIRKMVPKLVQFIDKYKKKTKGPVIYINCTKWDKKHLADNINELYKDPKCRYYSKDKSGFREKFYGVKPEKDDLIFTKNHYDAFTNLKFVNYL
ncbi:cysteine hydrolase, partial [Candidatus Woesearchaeota archaeon]|nr:cysteine hydrolase [Candidatus Woesearchaeota archaeon]